MKNYIKKCSSRYILYLLIIFFIVITVNICFKYYFIPNELYLIDGRESILEYNLPIKISINAKANDIIEVNGNLSEDYFLDLSKPVRVESNKTGEIDISLKIFGVIPVNSIKVKVLPNVEIYPGGQLIGVKLNTKGVIVVGIEELEGEDGSIYTPAIDAQLLVGDIIYKINNVSVNTAKEVSDIINNLNDKPLELEILRKNKRLKVMIKPVKCKQDDKYKIGVWVRDNTAGIGTLTFFLKETNKFGALGHAITDVTTGVLMPIKQGEIVSSRVASILPGKSGQPGEIRGIFYDEESILGNLTKNTQYGIYGNLYEKPEKLFYDTPIEIGLQHEVEIGPAKILTTLENDEIEEYDIYIEKKSYQSKKEGKGMVIRVTDERLIDETGGIIQGMSGSPIIQNNKLIGAVTHVFVNDPTKGYGIFIEWMLEEAEVQIVE